MTFRNVKENAAETAPLFIAIIRDDGVIEKAFAAGGESVGKALSDEWLKKVRELMKKLFKEQGIMGMHLTPQSM